MSETTGPQPGIAEKKTHWVWHSKIELAYTKTILLVMISDAVVAQTANYIARNDFGLHGVIGGPYA